MAIPEADATPDEAFELGRVAGYDEGMAESSARVAELEAVIQKVRRHAISGANIGQPGPHDGFEEGLDHGAAIEAEATLRILSAAPSVVLGEHDQEVRAQAIEDAAEAAEEAMDWDYLEGASNWLRERAAAIRNGEHA